MIWSRSSPSARIRLLTAFGLAAATSLLGLAVAQAAVTETVEFTIKVAKGDKQKRNGGLTVRTVFRVQDDTGIKPIPLTKTTLRFPKGAKVNAKYFKADVRRLRRSGPAALSVTPARSSATSRPRSRCSMVNPQTGTRRS